MRGILKRGDLTTITKVIPANHLGDDIPEHYKCLEIGDVCQIMGDERFNANKVNVLVVGKRNVKSE